jgi:hypothetical protein
MVDDIGRTTRYREYTWGNYYSCEQAIQVCEGHQQKAHPQRHHHHVQQGIANGHIAIIGHHSQHEDLGYYKKQESPQLGGTFIV